MSEAERWRDTLAKLVGKTVTAVEIVDRPDGRVSVLISMDPGSSIELGGWPKVGVGA